MTLKLEFANSYCCTSFFVINGTDADEDDFGEKFDRDAASAEPYGCGNMRFTRKAPTDSVLAEYGITESEYTEIAAKLEAGLSFGRCGWCV